MAGDDTLFEDMFLKGDQKSEEPQIEHAVVIVGEFDSRLIFGRGAMIENDREAGLGSDEAGPTYLSPDEKGIWIWEGIPVWRRGYTGIYGEDDGGEPGYKDRGTWRRPTDEEALKIAKGDFSFFGPEVLYGRA